MGLRNFMKQTVNTLKLSRKSGKQEFTLYVKLVAIGLGVVGAIGFVVQFVASLLRLTGK